MSGTSKQPLYLRAKVTYTITETRSGQEKKSKLELDIGDPALLVTEPVSMITFDAYQSNKVATKRRCIRIQFKYSTETATCGTLNLQVKNLVTEEFYLNQDFVFSLDQDLKERHSFNIPKIDCIPIFTEPSETEATLSFEPYCVVVVENSKEAI